MLVNSLPRRWLQRFYELSVFRRLGGSVLAGGRVLELGCGAGYGTQLILDNFEAGQVAAIDLDPAMVTRARRRLAGYGERVRVSCGSATDLRGVLGADEDTYDTVFDFAIIHHIPDWRAALDEVSRVLKPGGAFVFDEVTAIALASRTYRLLFDHPEHDRFTAADFVSALADRGLHVGGRVRMHRGGRYLLGVARSRT
nr:class I SAM-dependent methyltransferase [Amycolatopsis marina]